MLKRMIIYQLMVATSSLIFAGCGEYTKMSVSDVLNSKHKRVSEVTTTDGERIIFDSAGAKYLSNSKSILGITRDGTRAVKSTCDLEQISLADTTGEDTLPLVLPAGEIASHFSQKRFDRIAALVTKQGERYRFSNVGATLDQPNQTIKGTTLEFLQSSRHSSTQPGATSSGSNHVYGGNFIAGSAVVVPFDSVDYVEVHQPRDTRVLQGFLIAGCVAVIVYGIATAVSDDDWDFDLSGWDYDPWY